MLIEDAERLKASGEADGFKSDSAHRSSRYYTSNRHGDCRINMGQNESRSTIARSLSISDHAFGSARLMPSWSRHARHTPLYVEMSSS
jgi:hypothetical protein